MSVADEQKELPVSEFKAHLAEWLRKVEEDQKELRLTRRGKVIATLLPASVSGQPDAKDMDLVEYARWVTRKFGGVKFADGIDPDQPAVPAEEWNAVRGELD